MTTTRHRATARLAARYGKLHRLTAVSATATAALVVAGVTAVPSTESGPDTVAKAQTVSLGTATEAFDEELFAKMRDQRVSRAATRLAPRVSLEPKATDHEFATALLNIWEAPREGGKRFGVIEWGTKVAVTGQVVGHWAEVLLPAAKGKGKVARWVNAHYLAEQKPKPEPEPAAPTGSTGSTGSTSSSSPAPAPTPEPAVGGACTNGTSVSGVPNVVEIHQAVCANWPAITSYGTYRADSGDHGSGRAIDIMISGATGWDIAEYLRANYSTFGISYIIYAQKIWSVDRAGEGWRYMEDRGSTTANHYDHVHVSVY